jgi:hypothetical protein
MVVALKVGAVVLAAGAVLILLAPRGIPALDTKRDTHGSETVTVDPALESLRV